MVRMMIVSARTTAPDKRVAQSHEHLTDPAPQVRERSIQGNDVRLGFCPKRGDFRSEGELDAYTEGGRSKQAFQAITTGYNYTM